MRIAINCRMLIPDKLEGIGWFTYELVKRMIRNHPEDTFILLFDRKPPDELLKHPNVIKLHSFPQARHPLLFKWWFDYSVPSMLKKQNADIFVSPDGFNSGRLKIPSYLIIHDIAWHHYPDFIKANHLRYYRNNIPKFISNATGLGTVSEFSRTDIAEKFELNPSAIDVVYNGCRTIFKPLPEAAKQMVRKEWGITQPYFVFTGSIHPRKNGVNLLRAYHHFRLRSHLTHSLVFAGRKAWEAELFEKELQNSPFRKQILVTGYIEDNQMASLLGAAEALVYPSLFEGFGVPLLEAMNVEIPIITSNVSSLPEVAGNAALLTDPKNPQDIGTAMYKLAKTPELREKLIENGKKQRLKFNWDRSAAQLYENIEKTVLRSKRN